MTVSEASGGLEVLQNQMAEVLDFGWGLEGSDKTVAQFRIFSAESRCLPLIGSGNLKKVTPGPLVVRCNTMIPAGPELYMVVLPPTPTIRFH